ncbi:MAG: hypothetical protein C6W58_17895, partial [Bacillaceae bacterium]
MLLKYCISKIIRKVKLEILKNTFIIHIKLGKGIKDMKIAINATILDDKPTGLGIFTINIIQNLSKLIGSKDEIIVYTSNPSFFKEYPITIKKVNSMMQPKKGKLAGIMSNLELRPMYHRVESRIRGHIMVCFLALVMESFLAYKLKEIGC